MSEDQFYNSIEDYYKNVDNLKEINSVSLSHYLNEFREKSKRLNNNEKKQIELEIDCLNFLVRKGQIKPLYTRENEDGIIDCYPNLSSIDNSEIDYLKNRLEKIKNIYFKTRLTHILWVKTGQYEYATSAADCYFLLAENYRKLDIKKPMEHYGIEICYALWNLQDLVFSLNYKIEELKNYIGKLSTEEDELKHRMYNYCDIWYDMQSKIFSHFLKKTIELKKINAEIVLQFLKNTWYGANIEKELADGNIYKYNWLQYIGPSLESFFLKFEKFIQGDQSSNLYIQEIDSLSLKIEGIIRDMIWLANIDDFHTFYFDKNKNFYWCNINQYLKDHNIFRIIPENDVYFLEYFFIEHRNLRNRIAHSLTFLGEYGIYNMVILFIAILRLSKCLVLNKKNN